ncbi:hypothetical protein C2S52_012391 [Perilla frutescens var. hirtella]|nr:hypothetical protein C2S52_012391 [Perilla frutescens var. hirtella]
MAEVVISPLLQVIFEKLASPILAKFELGKNYKKDLDKLRRTLPIIQAIIEDAEVKQWKDKKVRIWLVELKSLAYDVDDLLDVITARQHRNKVRHATCTLSPMPLLSNYYHMPQKLKSVQDRLDEVVSKMSCFQFTEMVSLARSQTSERRETGYYVDESDVFGRTEDLERVVSFVMCSGSDGVKVRSLSIVGIGGMGKTTLAQLVYNDERVEKNFDLRIWISVCQEFDVKRIMHGILDYADHRPKCDSKQLGVLQSELHKSLNGKRYILVLDDVWNHDQDEWEKLQYPLRSGAEGSRIIVTTRHEKVASIVSTTAPYFLEALGYDDCLDLFNKRAFPDGEQDSYLRLLEIGREIVKKCRGVPLAAKIFGSLMHFKREEKEWLHVLESELWNMDMELGENKIMSALRLSYNHLPCHLKRCFAYCAVLPKGFEMRRDKLIHLWIAEGLIQSSNDNAYSLRKMEDAGNEYFNEFLLMSLFQLVDTADQFQMHDLLHALAKQVAGNEFLTYGEHDREHDRRLIYHGADDQLLSQLRHAAVVCNSVSSIPKTLYGARQLRTLILFSPDDDSNRILNTVVRAFKRLRVLDLSDSGIKRLSKSVGSLVHLRYFDLSRTFLETLPKAVCRLCNLQTLNLTDCYNLKALPEGMKHLINLRHLIIKNCARLTRMPPSIRALLNLQTLSFYIVGRSFEESLFQLVHLDLRGEIKIRHLENADEIVPDLCFEEKQLHSLGLSWGDDVEEAKLNDSSISPVHEHHGCDNEILLNYLKPNTGLRKLYLSGYYGLNFPHWLNYTTSPNLREVVLKNCRRCECLPPLGQLQFLEALYMQGLEALKSIGDQFYGEERNQTTKFFPSLKQLTIQNCPALENWESLPPSINAFTSLDRLSLIECARLETMPFFPKVKQLELKNCSTRIIRKAAELTTLSTLIINDFQDLTYLPQGLLQNNPSLQSLTISSCPQLTSLPWDLRNLEALQSLTIRWCNELTSFPKEIRHFTSLEALEITECPSLTSLPEEGIMGLQSLRSLSIENCLNLTSLPNSIMQLYSLERLTIMYCPSLAKLPDGVQQLPALRSLSIISCQELACLPEELQHVKTLENLEIFGCPKLMELPEWVEHLLSLRSLKIYNCCGIKTLPKGLECLKALQHLSIRDCPDLEEKCVKGKGNNWTLIAHVPYLYIGSSAVELQGKAVAGNLV